MFFSRGAGIKFVDRGDITSSDFLLQDLTADDSWHDLDISAIVGARKCLVLLTLFMNATTDAKRGRIRTKGNENAYNIMAVYTQVASKTIQVDGSVFTNSSGILEYNFATATWNSITISIRAWTV